MAMTASTRPPRNETRPASALKPTKPAARRTRLRLSAPAKGIDAGDRPPLCRFSPEPASLPTGLHRVIAIPRQSGDDVHLVTEFDQLSNDPRHHHTRRRSVRCEVRAEDRNAQAVASSAPPHDRSNAAVYASANAAPDARAVNDGGARRALRRSSCRDHGPPDRARRPTPRSRAATPGLPRRRSPVCTLRRSRSPGQPSAIASISGAPKPSYWLGNTIASAMEQEAVAIGRRDAPRRRTRESVACRTSSSAVPLRR